MEFKKNDTVTLYIEDMGHDGEGIGKADGYTLFVKDTVIGDKVEAKIMKMKKNYGYARLMKVLEPSKDRVQPRCPAARACGGCQLQFLSYEKQLEFKKNKVKGNLERIGGFENICIEQVIGMEEPWRYRNKAQFPVGKNKDGEIITGFYAGRTHSIISNKNCYLGTEVNEQILEEVLVYMKENHIEPYDEVSGTGLVRHVLIRCGFKTGEIMVCLVLNGDALPKAEKLTARLQEIPGMTSITFNVNKKRNNVILGDKIVKLWGQDYISDYIGEVQYRISPLSFYQVNPVQTEKLYNLAIELAGLTGKETVLDAYCGIGTIGIIASRKAGQVIGVELNQDAVRDAVNNAKLNQISNIRFYCNDAGQFMVNMAERGDRADVVIMDPPRSGSTEKFMDSIKKMGADKLVYISCNPETLARDLRYMKKLGYRVDGNAVGVDMFAETYHVETVVLLSHKKPDGHINVKVEFGEGEGKVPLDNIAKRAEEYKPKERVTYKMIKEYIEAKYGFKVHTAYIAEVKRDLGLPMYDAPNAVEELKQPRKIGRAHV